MRLLECIAYSKTGGLCFRFGVKVWSNRIILAKLSSMEMFDVQSSLSLIIHVMAATLSINFIIVSVQCGRGGPRG